jgi:cytochrome bd ubiquinol oxidase subunit I
MDAFTLSRLQFAANITFHILFPSLTIAMGWMLVGLRIWRQRGGGEESMVLYRFLVKIFALCFGLGVTSGIVMSFQFGTNWPGFMNTVGNVAGPLLAYEVLSAFFLEATFLGIMLFGEKKVPAWVHLGATVLVAAGTTLSAFWILALNSWMHTPTGFVMRDGVAHVTNWGAVLFSPSMPYRLTHTLLGSGLAASFLTAGLLAYRYALGERSKAVLRGLRICLVTIAILAPLQALAGDKHGVNTREHQPAKLAAMEALWETTDGAPLLLFAMPDSKARANRLEVGVPKLASLIATHDPNGRILGLNAFGKDIPPVAPVFWAFRTMVGLGMLMIAVGAWGAWIVWRKREFPPLMIGLLRWMTYAGWIATVAGWYVTEMGRQPWLVTGVLRARDAVANVPPANVGTTLVAYLVTYALLLVAFGATLRHLSRQEVKKAEVAA